MKKPVLFFSLYLFLSCSSEESIQPTPDYILTVTTSEGGSVDNNGGNYSEGDVVTINATPNPGYTFTGWTGDLTESANPLSIEIENNTNITAQFSRIKYLFDIDILGEGNVSREIVSSGKTPTEYNSGTILRLQSIPNDGWLFYSWSGAASSTENTIDLNIDASKSVTATFEQRQILTSDSEEETGAGVGKWKIRRRPQQKIYTDQCEIFEVIFRSDSTFTIVSAVGTNSGEYSYTDENSIELTIGEIEYARFENIVLTNSFMSFTLLLGPCNDVYEADKDYSYSEQEDPLTGNVSDTNTNTSGTNNQIYFENGTCKCPNASVGGTSIINGVIYTVVDNNNIHNEINNGNFNLCTSLVTNMNGLFQDKSTFNADINFWDVSNVSNMTDMFNGANIFNQDLSNWDVSSVISFNYMFFDASAFNGDIVNWDISSAQYIHNMFNGATVFNQNIGGWNTSSVIGMAGVFDSAENFNQDISNWNTSSVNNMESMFFGATVFNQDISNWDVSNVIDMRNMFHDALAFNQPIGNWDVSNVTNMRFMFSNATSFNSDIGGWNVSNVTNIGQIFSNATSFNQDIGNWNVSNVTSLEYTFENAIVFNQDIGGWNVSQVTNMLGTFAGATSFNQDVGAWDTSQVIHMESVFSGANSFNQDISNWDTSNATSMFNMFFEAQSFNQNIGSWDISRVTSTKQMFDGAGSFNQDIGSWDTSNITNMIRMFKNATLFNQDLTGWCVTSITTEPEFFSLDSQLEESNKPIWGTCPD